MRWQKMIWINLFLFLLFTTVLIGKREITAQSVGSEEGCWTLVWEDNFDGTSLNTEAWTLAEQGLNWNNEDQAYIRENATTENGCLVLTAKKERWDGLSHRVDCPDRRVTQEYTSGEANTKGSWQYGKFEASIKMPNTRGVLGAFWMTPLDRDWPPEIDIVEVLGHDPHTAYFTNHYGTPSNHQMGNGNCYNARGFAEGFHTYAVEWEPKAIRWYIDGVKQLESRSGVPKEPFILRLSLPVGPDWEGNPSSSSVFPQQMAVDWVRVYQKT